MKKMQTIELVAEKRTIKGKQVKRLRRQGLVPAVIYGHLIEPIEIQVAERDLRHALDQAGSTHLVALRIAGTKKPHQVLTKEIQYDPITGTPLHVDFQEIVMTEKITAEIPIVLVGESPAVRRGDGALLQALSSVQVECLPGDLISAIEINLGDLEAVEDTVLVSDLQVSDTMQILNDPEEVVVKILPAVAEAEAVEEGEAEIEAEAEAKAGTSTEGVAE